MSLTMKIIQIICAGYSHLLGSLCHFYEVHYSATVCNYLVTECLPKSKIFLLQLRRKKHFNMFDGYHIPEKTELPLKRQHNTYTSLKRIKMKEKTMYRLKNKV